MPGNHAGNQAAVLGVQVIRKGFRIAGVVGEHVPVAGDHQAGTKLPGEVGRFLEGHVADAVPPVPGAVASVDGEKRGVDGAAGLQQGKHPFIAQGIPGMVNAYSVALNDILQAGIQAGFRIPGKEFMGCRNGMDLHIPTVQLPPPFRPRHFLPGRRPPGRTSGVPREDEKGRPGTGRAQTRQGIVIDMIRVVMRAEKGGDAGHFPRRGQAAEPAVRRGEA